MALGLLLNVFIYRLNIYNYEISLLKGKKNQ